MSATEPYGSELSELRRCVRDLSALAALPVVWSAAGAEAVVASLAEALLGMLRLDFVFIRFAGPDGIACAEVGRLAGRPSSGADAAHLGQALAPWLDGDRSTDGVPAIDGCPGPLRGLVLPFGLDSGKGLVAAGSRVASFPTERDRLLLRVSANQAAVILARRAAEAERERLLREIEAERALLSEVFQHAPSFMCVLSGPDHVFELANDHYRRLVGMRDVAGKPIRQALPEIAKQGFVDLLDRVYRTGEAYAGHEVPVRLAGAGGREEEVFLDFVYQAMRDPDGSVKGVFVQGIDLTERKRTQAELRAKDARLQLLMDNVKDYAVVITDARGVIVEWAGGAHRITGIAPGEAIGQPIDILFTEEDRALGQPAAERRLADQEGRSEDQRWHLRADGRRFFADGLTSPLYDGAGSLQGFGKIFRDATAEWEAREARRRSEEELSRLLEAEKRRVALLARVAHASRAMNAVLSVESITRVLTEEARAIVGAHLATTTLAMEDDRSRTVSAVSSSDKYEDFAGDRRGTVVEEIGASVLRTSEVLRLTQAELEQHPAWRRRASDGAGQPSSRGLLAVPLVGHGQRNLGLVLLSDKYEGDFTQEDEAILQQLAATAAVGIENARLYDSLKEQDRRKDEFLAMLAHELRNPLAPVRSGLDILQKAGDAGPAAARTREMMSRQIGHMVRLIDDLMDVSRISSGKLTLKLQPTPFRAVIEAALDASRPLIEAAGHTLALDVEEADVVVQGDLTRLSQVLGNLLNNAAKYTPPGGSIRLMVRREGSDVLAEVQDSGIGIPAEKMSSVFELFTQLGPAADRAQGGLGIGLALARKLAEIHGGTLEASSAGPGQGATFTFRLPLVHVEPAQPQKHSDSAPESGALRILVVDDNVDAAETFAQILGMAGHETTIAHSGPAALEAASSNPPDIIFLDIGLPGMSGYDVARRLRTDPRMNDTVIVALTGWGSEADRTRARQAGFDHHLTKPVETAEAEAIVRAVALRLTEGTTA